jgi:hypothetical protein
MDSFDGFSQKFSYGKFDYFGHAAPASLSWMVLVTTRLSMGDSEILEMAGPDRMGCVQHA